MKRAIGSLVLTLLLGTSVASTEPPRIVRVSTFPERVVIEHELDRAQLVLTAETADGQLLDVTRRAVLQHVPAFASVDESRSVQVHANGVDDIVFTFEGHTVSVHLEVTAYGRDERVSFVRDVEPVLSYLGGNAGTCHGSAKGKNGFQLSLRGYDPAFDHRALTDDLAGRRFDRVHPERSLFLAKPSGDVPHAGGTLLARDDPEYQVLLRWIEQGASFDRETTRVARLEVYPAERTLQDAGDEQQLAVHAVYPDGSRRDVTAHAALSVNDLEVASVGDGAIVRALRRGEFAVLARYEGAYASARFFVMGEREGFTWENVPAWNAIDEHVYERLRAVRTRPSALVSDAEFLRRVTLDLTGRIPTRDEVRTVLLDRREPRRKREEIVDRLIGSPAFVEHWTNKWCDLLQVHSRYLGDDGARALREWIRTQVASNVPYDRFVRELLTASGSTLANPPAAFLKIHREPDLAMEAVTQVFLGVRFNCNKCHDHPFERWTQANHWELAAYFAQVGRRDAEGSKKMPRTVTMDAGREPPAFEEIITDEAEGELERPDGKGVAPARFPYSLVDGESNPTGTRRQRLAQWLTDPTNSYFARSYVNRVWSYFFGRGLIDPVDDIRASNPPTHPALLDHLTRAFVESGFDVRALMRTICTSRTYQHSVRSNDWNEDDHVHYARALPRRLPAEVLFDAVHRAAGSRVRLPGRRPGVGATALVDGSVELEDSFLDLFGAPPRESPCECERASDLSLGQALQLVNGETLAKVLEDEDNVIHELVHYEARDDLLLEELYVSFLGRLPTEVEREALLPSLDASRAANRTALPPELVKQLDQRVETYLSKHRVHPFVGGDPGTLRSRDGAVLEELEDGSILVSGDRHEKDRYTVVAWTDRVGLTGVRLEALPHESLTNGGPGRAENGNFVLSQLHLTAVSAQDPTQSRKVAFGHASADFSQTDWDVSGALRPDRGWAVMPRFGAAHEAVFEATEDFGYEGGTLLVFQLDMNFGGAHTLGRFRLGVTHDARPVRYHGLPEDVAMILALPREERSTEQNEAFFRFYVSQDATMRERIRLYAAQDVAWALAMSPAFLFNR
ncbi:MAG: DUF1553 domain-containing protein [Planctomycetes bacterium]|nr:DUF1553 domain-containing protein [Planctomycetota bacterium]MCB9891549.1 DUF1553 domain-containing protein [Planctomycetota bacterium]